jgi:hypothetical protein
MNEINNILKAYQDNESFHREKNETLQKSLKHQELLSITLMEEIKEKDKLLILNEKKFIDYESMINKIQDEANKEQSNKERHDMLRIQDKEIHKRDCELKKLQDKIIFLEDKVSMSNTNTITSVINDMEEEHEMPASPGGSIHSEDDKTIDMLEPEPSDDDSADRPLVGMEHNEVEDVGKEEEVEDVGKEEEEEEEEEDDEDAIVVDIIKHYKKEYYIILKESPQYIYAIEDGELGDKVGELKNNKKVFYNSSKK